MFEHKSQELVHANKDKTLWQTFLRHENKEIHCKPTKSFFFLISPALFVFVFFKKKFLPERLLDGGAGL